MPSIYGRDHRNQVAAARGNPPGWGNMLPGQLSPQSSAYVSPLMGGLRPDMQQGSPWGSPSMVGARSGAPQPPGGPMGSRPPMGSIPSDQELIKAKSGQVGPVNPGGPSIGLPGQGGGSQTLPYSGPNPQLFGALAGRYNIGRR